MSEREREWRDGERERPRRIYILLDMNIVITPWVIAWSNIINIIQEKKIVYATYKMKVRCLIFRLGQWETFVCDMHICIDMVVKDDRNKWFPTCNFTDIRFLRNYLCSHYTLCFTLLHRRAPPFSNEMSLHGSRAGVV